MNIGIIKRPLYRMNRSLAITMKVILDLIIYLYWDKNCEKKPAKDHE